MKSWQEVNVGLGKLAKLEAEAAAMKETIKAFAAKHKRELEGKTMTLANGQVGYRVEERAKVADEDEAIGILLDSPHAAFVRTVLDKPGLAKSEDALALIPGAKVERKLVFVCKPNPLGRAVKQ